MVLFAIETWKIRARSIDRCNTIYSVDLTISARKSIRTAILSEILNTQRFIAAGRASLLIRGTSS